LEYGPQVSPKAVQTKEKTGLVAREALFCRCIGQKHHVSGNEKLWLVPFLQSSQKKV
jgi:hypothetical protein